MTRDDIIRMARDASLMEQMPAEDDLPAVWMTSTPELERFAALVAAAEREACAKVCESLNEDWNHLYVESCAFAIRERGAP